MLQQEFEQLQRLALKTIFLLISGQHSSLKVEFEPAEPFDPGLSRYG
jgi:hypothetical protein